MRRAVREGPPLLISTGGNGSQAAFEQSLGVSAICGAMSRLSIFPCATNWWSATGETRILSVSL